MSTALGSWFTRLIGRFRRVKSARTKVEPTCDVGDVTQAGYVWLQNDWGEGILGQF